MSIRRNPAVPFALECVLLFLACSVFGWGLQAKLSLYHSGSSLSYTSPCTAKLLSEKPSTRTVASVEDKQQPRFTSKSTHFAVYAFFLQGYGVPQGALSRIEPDPGISGRYNLRGPNLLSRPPPTLS